MKDSFLNYRPRLTARLGVFFCGLKIALERYVRLLELQEKDIAAGEWELLALRNDQEQSLMREITELHRAVVPLEELLLREAGTSGPDGGADGTGAADPSGSGIPEDPFAAVKAELEALRLAALARQETNGRLARAQLEVIRNQMEQTRRGTSSIRRDAASSSGSPRFLNITA